MVSLSLEFIVENIIPWLIFSGFVYASSSYLTKGSNTAPNLWWSALVVSFLPFISLSFGVETMPLPDLGYITSGMENAQIVKQASITHASLKAVDRLAYALLILYLCFTSLKLVQLMITWKKIKTLSQSSLSGSEWFINNTKVQISSYNHSPFVFGATSPRIVLPQYFSCLEAHQQNILIQHELTHIENKDHIATLIWRILSIIFWINPFVKKMELQFIRAMEHQCDRQTIARYRLDKQVYATTLLTALKRSALIDTNNPVAQFSSGALCTNDYKMRLTHIISPSNKSRVVLGVTFSVIMLILFVLHLSVKNFSGTGAPTWQHPLERPRITSTFSSISKIRQYKPHKGVDYVAEAGSPVMSAADGMVIVADNITLHANYGNTVLIQHKAGYQTLYSHLDAIGVKVGTWVDAGQAIGIIGDTGKATGIHLHFEVIKDNQRIDPSIQLNKEN